MSIEYVDQTEPIEPAQPTGIAAHPFLWILVAALAAFVVIRFMQAKGSSANTQQSSGPGDSAPGEVNANLPGPNGPLGSYAALVPTENDYESIVEKSRNDTNKTTITNSGNTTVTPPPVVQQPPPTQPPPVKKPPKEPHIPLPPPKQTKGSWACRYTVREGDNLTKIATIYKTLWPAVYAHNQRVIDDGAAQHHSPIPGGPWNNIFPGQVLIVPCQ